MMLSTRSRAFCTAASSRLVACTMATRPSSPVKSRMPPRSAARQARAGQARPGGPTEKAGPGRAGQAEGMLVHVGHMGGDDWRSLHPA
jgi:hypothetical protein